jgi:hypothetical protein
MYFDDISGFGFSTQMNGPCNSLDHSSRSSERPQATMWDQANCLWRCFTCAQKQNRKLVALKIDPRQAGCISGAERTLQLLRK